MEKITILGAGSFGSALAQLMALKGYQPLLWGRDANVVKSINEQRVNHRYFPHFEFHPGVTATEHLAPALEKASLILFCLPTQIIRSFLEKNTTLIPPQALLINTAKGIEQKTLLTPSRIFADILGQKVFDRFATLSGPTFASELFQGQPAGAAIASQNRTTAKTAQKMISGKTFRLYTTSDLLGVELGGALKNVMAIGTGIAEGLGFGLNTRAGLITRCLHEMTKLGVRMGANPLTFAGLSGVGDLVLTCTGALSRNRHVGMELGQGKKLTTILTEMKTVAEGVPTAQSVHELSKSFEVDMPNSEYVYRMLYQGLAPKLALQEILARELKDEIA